MKTNKWKIIRNITLWIVKALGILTIVLLIYSIIYDILYGEYVIAGYHESFNTWYEIFLRDIVLMLFGLWIPIIINILLLMISTIKLKKQKV